MSEGRTMPTVRRLSSVAALATLIACGRGAGPGKPPTVDELFEADLAASGGRAAWESIRTIRSEGTLNTTSDRAVGEVVMVARAPNLRHMFITTPSQVMESGCDGTTTWSVDGKDDPRILTGGQAARALRDASIKSLDWRRQYERGDVVGPVTYHDHPAWKVVFKAADLTTTVYYDRATHLELGKDSTERTPSGDITSRMYFPSYRRFGAIKQPDTITTNFGDELMVIKIETLDLNPRLQPTAFALPPEVAALRDAIADDAPPVDEPAPPPPPSDDAR